MCTDELHFKLMVEFKLVGQTSILDQTPKKNKQASEQQIKSVKKS